MANSNNTNNSNTSSVPNQIDADNLYGLRPNTGCLQGTCPANTIYTGTYIPSLQEIAAYNTSAPNVGTINPNSMQQNQSYYNSNAMQNEMNGNEQILPSQMIPDTPATTLDYGATMGTTVREDLDMGISDYANPNYLM